MDKKRSISNFREVWLADFFEHGGKHRKIPSGIENVLARKLDIINAAISYKDLRSPPANHYEELNPPLGGYSSIRVNDQYRLIFVWAKSKASDLYLDAHGYKKHK
ncbi:type II toxin-antitoxin system RelE/ParE family toxin [Yersinia kristensenii]|uniref:Type II toxin-antitoxin system RelE/ParE family toxin n=1 Tax=Yersinia kristensenii TaxID=28152 RepID=A0AB73P810_YERKR|nr:type II toxin-antitoxin system RelE/ParE family toxin [Yersinia kristensenii]OVZ80607.1 hypothetical protein CBW52_11035 [Yersinia kristensenii]QKJ14421.1 type II toxin-antitoxin system RelE/ParE family toxin [Yersinia kristensenii]CNL26729.1 Toxin higB-1 [Yersinia kristensenii]